MSFSRGLGSSFIAWPPLFGRQDAKTAKDPVCLAPWRQTSSPLHLQITILGGDALDAHLLRRALDGVEDLDVARAAAHVPADGLADLLARRVGRRAKERVRRHDEARRAEAA